MTHLNIARQRLHHQVSLSLSSYDYSGLLVILCHMLSGQAAANW